MPQIVKLQNRLLFLAATALTVMVVTALASASGAVEPQALHKLYVSPHGSGNSCTRSAPCRSFDRAYHVARPGQVVVAAGGTYGQQVIRPDSSKRSSRNVVFRPAKGAKVIIGCPDDGIGCLDIFGSHITIRNMHIAYMPPINGHPWQGTVGADRGSSDVLLVNIDGGALFMASPNSTVRGGDWGPSTDPNNMRIEEECVNCTLDGLNIHGFVVAQGGHFECITFEGGTHVTIENSTFRSCPIFSIFAKPNSAINGALIQNNVFWNPDHVFLGNDIKFSDGAGGSCSNIVIRYNTIGSDIYDSCGPPIKVVGNLQLGDEASCGPDWDYNVFVNATPCGRHATPIRNARFVNAAKGNFRLRRGSPAIGRGSPTFFPRFDKAGRRRPAGKRADAGAYEASLAKKKR